MFAPGFAPYAFSENIVTSKLALAMLSRGWELDVVSMVDEGPAYDCRWREPWLPLRPIAHEIRYPIGPPVVRHVCRAVDSVVLRYPIAGVRWARQALRKAIHLHRTRPYDVVLSRFPSAIAHLPAMHFAAATGVPWVANWNDPPSHLFPQPYHIRQTLSQRWINTTFLRKAFARATINTFPCPRLARHVQRGLGMQGKTEVAIIPHPTLDGYRPPRAEPGDKFRLCHAGNLAAERNPRPFLQAFKRLSSEKSPDRVRFDLIGVENVAWDRLIGDEELSKNVDHVGRMGYLDSLAHQARASVLVLIEAPCREGIFLPSKLTDYVQLGKPVLSLSPREGTINDLLGECGGGIAVDCNSVDDIYRSLATLYDSWQAGRLNEYCSAALLARFSAATVLDHYEELFGRLITGRVSLPPACHGHLAEDG